MADEITGAGQEDKRLPEEKIADLVAADVNRLEALLKQLEESADAAETAEIEHAARSPMSLVWELIGCQFAKMNFKPDKNIPEYEFIGHPCIFGKVRPDQDCRTCAHVTYHRVGANQPEYEKRYFNTGTVLPVTEEEAEAIAEFLKEKGIRPTERHVTKVHAVRTMLENARGRERQSRVEAIEARQRYQGR